MKCPDCGFVSFPQPAECKKCGHRFDTAPQSAGIGSGGEFSFRSQGSTASLPLRAPAPEAANINPPSAQPAEDSSATVPGGDRSADPSSGTEVRAAKARAQAWESEIADRVARYRRRRGSGHDAESDDNLEFDFSIADRRRHKDDLDEDRVKLDLVLDNHRGSDAEAPTLDSIPIQRDSGTGLRPEDAVEWALEPSDFRVADPEPVEIMLDPDAEGTDEESEIFAGRRHLAAPIGLRFAAVIVDALILLISAIIFALIFWKSGGRLTFSRHGSDVTNLLVVAALAAFFMMFYFGLFTALAFATPGQSVMGLQVRTLDDELPDSRAARRRALGYLVSAAALMLGFVWAVFDVDGLCWHDRVSGTCLARQRN